MLAERSAARDLLPECQLAEDGLLLGDERFDAALRHVHHLLELRIVEGMLLRRSLNFDDLLAAGHHQVHVYVRARVFLVVQVEQNFAIYNADAGTGHKIAKRRGRKRARLYQSLQRDRKSTRLNSSHI